MMIIRMSLILYIDGLILLEIHFTISSAFLKKSVQSKSMDKKETRHPITESGLNKKRQRIK